MYFYLQWKDRRPEEITLLKERPKSINFESTFKINSKEYIICGNINSALDTYYPPDNLLYQKNQYLLSHLQKSIRKMENIRAVQTAKHIIDLDLMCFLRRLPIIMLEDVTLHSSFPVLIWLMISNGKGFLIKKVIIQWLLGVVNYLSMCSEKTNYLNEPIKEIDIEYNETDIVLQSLRFRKRYGGMKGDMNMIEYYTQLLHNKKLTINDCKISIINLNVRPLKKKDWIIEANDFHCNRYILTYISSYFPKLKKDYIQLLIWIFSSSQNNRVPLENQGQKKIDDWNMIKDHVIHFQKSCKYY
tara:strand:+ start:169 stop:1071 length:903 start_codon:yes stop_codon:yes gene_type:complete